MNYANVDVIVDVAVKHGVDAVWPGWGHASGGFVHIKWEGNIPSILLHLLDQLTHSRTPSFFTLPVFLFVLLREPSFTSRTAGTRREVHRSSCCPHGSYGRQGDDNNNNNDDDDDDDDLSWPYLRFLYISDWLLTYMHNYTLPPWQ